ncbi:MAG: LysM peptidoglycan-binding domain-containing protein [Paucibacter sp.]|nr:LysM peptidoglycan-binding domain-containing protein [Roseateles sp.]
MPAASLHLRSAIALALLAALGTAGAAGDYPITPEQRATAERVAQAGVPISELAPNAPDTYTIKSGDTLWAISGVFLKSPWHWPELWGMNKAEIANPHLIYPGQVLMLVKQDGRAILQVARDRTSQATPGGVTKLSPRVRTSKYEDAIAAIPLRLIEPFLTEAVVFDADALADAPRVVAAPEGHVLVTRGDLAYARGNLSQGNEYRVFREARPLRDPGTGEVLGYEAPYVGTAELVAPGGTQKDAKGNEETVPATLRVRSVRQEVGVGDRLAPVEQREFLHFVPHAPDSALRGQIISVYGDALQGGQNQVVALNRGSQDGLERGHVLSLWKAGRQDVDRTSGRSEEIRLPDTRNGVLLVFQTYKRVSYALIISAQDAVNAGDGFTPP